MPLDKDQIANMALGHCGISVVISDLDNENSSEADAIRLFFDNARRMLLEIKPWNFASGRQSLALLTMDDAYKGDYFYMYQYPNNTARINEIINPYQRTPQSREDKITWEVKRLDSGSKIILTDQEHAVIDFNADIEDVSAFSGTFGHAHSLLIAHLAAPRLRVNASIMDRVAQQWVIWQDENVAQDLAEGQPDPEPNSTFEQARR